MKNIFLFTSFHLVESEISLKAKKKFPHFQTTTAEKKRKIKFIHIKKTVFNQSNNKISVNSGLFGVSSRILGCLNYQVSTANLFSIIIIIFAN